MSEETKNPLIESFLKLQERSTPITPKGPMPISGERLDTSGEKWKYDSSAFGSRENVMRDETKKLGEYGVSKLKNSSSLPDDDPFAAEKAQVQKRADEINKTQELRKQQDTASQQNVPLAQVRAIPSQTGVGRANTPVGGYQTKPTIKPAATGGTSAFTGMPKSSTGERTFADRTKDVEREFSVAKPGTTKYNMRMGSKGDDVKELQKSLGLKADGIYGEKTAAAVDEFQRKHGLKRDKIAGDQTMSKMKQVSALQNLRDTDPAGAAKQASTQLSQAKPIGSSIQASSPISGNRIFPKTSGVGGSGSMSGGFTSPNISAPSATTTPTEQPGITPYNAVMNNRSKPKTLMAHYEPGDNMPNKIIEAFMKLHSSNPTDLFAEAKKAKNSHHDKDKDGDKDFADVMISRMVASGMSREEAIAKVKSKTYNEGVLGIPAKKPTTEKGSVMPGYDDEDKPTIKPMPKVKGSVMPGYNEEIDPKIRPRKDPYGEGIAKPGTKAPEMVPAKEKATGVSPKGDLPKDAARSLEREREQAREIGEKGSRQRSIIDAAKEAANRGGGFRTPEAIAKGTGAMIAQPFAKAIDAVMGYKKPESKVMKTGPQSSIVMKNEEYEQLDEKYKVGDTVKPNMGPHKGVPHKVIHVHDDGRINIRPDVHPSKNQYRGGAVSVSSNQLMSEEVEQIDEATFKLTDAHKSAITKHLKNNLGKGKVTFHSEHGGHFATHSDGIQSTVHHIQMKNGKMTLSHFMTMDEEIDYLDEVLDTDEKKMQYAKKASDQIKAYKERGGAYDMSEKGEKDTKGVEKRTKGLQRLIKKIQKKTTNEEVEFSESELEHFAAILEGPVAPTPDGHDVKAFGSSTSISGTLTDEAIAEEEKKKRGRKPGVKVGAYGPRGAKKGEGEATTNVSVPHVFHQIRTSRADSQGNYNLQHEVGGKTLNAKVSARDAAEFSKKYMNTEKPREKEAHTDAFVAKHFGVSKPKATGITLPKMPPAKS